MMYQINYCKIALTFIIFFSNFVNGSDSATKTWKYSTNIFDKRNWLENSNEECHGLYFAENNEATIIITKGISFNQIILPKNGEIILPDESFIEFAPYSDCIRLKEINYYRWHDYNSWLGPDNPAIPHLERSPCTYDDVVFPEGIRTALGESNYFSSQVKSFTYGSIRYRSLGFHFPHYLPQEVHLIVADFMQIKIKIAPRGCMDPSGCLCHGDDKIYCPPIHDDAFINCLEPIQPLGFCGKICGAYLLFRPKIGFNLGQIQTKLQDFDVYTYASKVNNLTTNVIQIVFTEKKYSEKSVDGAKQFYSELMADSSNYNITNLELYVSGPYFIEGKSLTTSLSMIFGTLLGVTGVFAVLYYIYSDTNRYYTRPTRYFLARYQNTEEGGLIIEGQSLSGSVLSLEKSFDNPMYGQTPSTSTSMDTINTEEKSLKSETIHENPLYDIELKTKEMNEE